MTQHGEAEATYSQAKASEWGRPSYHGGTVSVVKGGIGLVHSGWWFHQALPDSLPNDESDLCPMMAGIGWEERKRNYHHHNSSQFLSSTHTPYTQRKKKREREIGVVGGCRGDKEHKRWRTGASEQWGLSSSWLNSCSDLITTCVVSVFSWVCVCVWHWFDWQLSVCLCVYVCLWWGRWWWGG